MSDRHGLEPVQAGGLELVEVWNEFSCQWTRGFVLVAPSDEGFLVRRAGEAAALPSPIPRSRVRRDVRADLSRPQDGENAVIVFDHDTFATASASTRKNVFEEFTSCSVPGCRPVTCPT